MYIADIGLFNSSELEFKLMIFNLEKYMNAKWMKKLSKATLRITFSVLILVLLERSLSNKNWDILLILTMQYFVW